jgi:hypothetical protein
MVQIEETNERWLTTAIRASVVWRSVRLAVIVGTILTFINHGDVILAGNVQAIHVSKILLTFCVPYVVSTIASVGAIRSR